MNIQFGTGILLAKPTAGNLPTNPTPLTAGVIQEATVDFKGDLKKLFSQYQLPIAVARGKIDVTIKAKLAVFDPLFLNQMYWAQATSQGYNKLIYGGNSTPIAVNSTTNTATVTNTPIVADWGVTFNATGQELIYVPNTASLTASGEYTVNLTTGVYSFFGADAASAPLVNISYTYFYNTTSGTTVTLANQLMGYAPELEMLLWNDFRNKYFAVQLNNVTLGGNSIPTKLEDFWIMDIDGAANVDGSNTLGYLMLDNF